MEEDNFVLSNFLEHFGDQSASDQDSLYMKHLSGIHQLVAMPSMIRAHDPKVAFLIECAGHQRHLRPGIGFIRSNKSITSNFLFQSIIVETIGKVSHLIELSKWLNLCEGGTSTKMRLPTVEDSQVLIDFFHESMISEGGYLKKKMIGYTDSTNKMSVFTHLQTTRTLLVVYLLIREHSLICFVKKEQMIS